MLARVSHIEAYRRWKGDEASTVEDLVRFITTDEPTEAMKAGTAFHKAMELVQDGEHEEFEANGYRFILPNAEISLPPLRELRGYGRYGDLTVTGQVDGIGGGMVIDHKTTSRFDAERYLNGCQWKFYLDLFEMDIFRWYVFEIKEIEPLVYRVSEPHILTAYRYPELHEDCAALASDYFDFARDHIPASYNPRKEFA